ncbi:helix-turn-helix domain-containing protein [Flavobacterium sp. Sd200]|uniref:helix-turn-helix transcriptional regulator n=1 Tax=Flavobacterium sp. Sd200 TaxID=2692211 RepID=UPI00136E42B0|nr:AraC family transcriptional regulator [Flavobacterium sp. Sd200]MXN90700.1 helix-turn-helix domain-containing protein [Flavobacterium sp. Sd200]
MYIRSKLREENETLYEISVPDEGRNESEIDFREIFYHKKDGILLKGRIFSTDGFILIETCFNNLDDYTELLRKRGEYVQMSLLLTGSVATFKKQYKKVRDLPKGILQLVFRGDTDVAMEMPRSKEPMRYIRIFLARPYYLSIMKTEKWAPSSLFYQNVSEGSYIHFGRNLIPISHALLQTILDILDNNYQGILKKYYTELKLRDLLLQLFICNTSGTNIPAINDKTSIGLETAKAYLVLHYNNPPTIKQLSRIVSLNELKLKTGFKEKFGSTIHEFIIGLRMQSAKKMLANSNPVNEVSAQLGYKSVSHFITSFKKFYGVTPKQFMVKDVLSKLQSNILYFFLSFYLNTLDENMIILLEW